MEDVSFVSADIEKIEQFAQESAEVIREFDAIKAEFENINSTLLNSWEGGGASAYKNETDHILEKVGGIEDILKGINESVIKDIREAYVNLDTTLGEFNKNPQTGGEEKAQ